MADSEDTLKTLMKWGSPSREWWNQAQDVYQEICTLLTYGINVGKHSNRLGYPWISVLPIGNFACELSSEDEDLQCIAIGSIRKELFAEVVWQNVIQWQDEGHKITPYEISDKGAVLELAGSVFNIRYIQCPQLVAFYPEILDTPPEFQETLPSEVEDIIDTLQEAETCLQRVRSSSAFLELYYFLLSWAKLAGLYSRRLGCLDSDRLRKLCQDALSQYSNDCNALDLSQVLCTLLRSHQGCVSDFQSGNVSLPANCLNIEGMSLSHLVTLHKEMDTLFRALEHEASPFGRDVSIDLDGLLTKMAKTPMTVSIAGDKYLQLTMHYSGHSQLSGTKMMVFVEDMLSRLLQDIVRALPKSSVRLWPQRLVSKDTSPTDSIYEGFWIVGLSQIGDNDATLNTILENWNNKICTRQEYSRSDMFVQVELVTPAVISRQSWKEDPKKWPRPTAEMDPSYRIEHQKAPASLPKPRLFLPADEIVSQPSTKLRPALDVLSRLKHDPSFDLDDYVVGYTDRHSGILEKAAGAWVTESTHDEWIPQGRIQHFRRISDGVVVWNRAQRVDLVFQG